jgi:hypothetical protein
MNRNAFLVKTGKEDQAVFDDHIPRQTRIWCARGGEMIETADPSTPLRSGRDDKLIE